jgi:hypothetical protein
VPIDANVNVQGRIAFRIVKSRLFPGQAAGPQATA